MMRQLACFSLLVAWLIPVECAFAEDLLTGTPYTIVWRGAPMALTSTGRTLPGGRAAPAASGGVLRVVDVADRQEIARAVYDRQLGGYMFTLPLRGLDNRAQRCLALLDGRNLAQVVRAPTSYDNGAVFRNPAWESELVRVSELTSLRTEREQVAQQAQSTDADIARLQTETGLPPGTPASQCPLPPAPPEPPRPEGALDAARLSAVAGPLCALRWEQEYGGRVDFGRLFQDAGLGADWAARGNLQALAEAFPNLALPVAGADLQMVLAAADKGRMYLEHADGVRLLNRAHSVCRDEVARRAAAASQRWQQAVADARQAPERSRQQCAQKLARIAQLKAAQGQAPAFLQALDARIKELSSPPPISDPQPLHAQLCAP